MRAERRRDDQGHAPVPFAVAVGRHRYVWVSIAPSTRAPICVGRALLFTPNPYQGGCSESHWDTIAFPNQLMEPAINGDLTHSVVTPQDLTFKLLQDIGW